jgi:hypothetical protein
MRTVVAFLLATTSSYAAEPRVHRDLPYAGTKSERQALDVYTPAEGKVHWTINSDLGLPDDKPTKALFEFLDGALKK